MTDRDQQFAQFVEQYPAARRQRGYMAETLFCAALEKISFDQLCHALQQHKRSEQWQTPRLIPMLTKWLQEERWIQVLDEAAIPDSRLTPGELARRYAKK